MTRSNNYSVKVQAYENAQKKKLPLDYKEENKDKKEFV